MADKVGVGGVEGYIIPVADALVHDGVLAATPSQTALFIQRIVTILHPGVVPDEFVVL